jgi:hypothetical protein
MQETSPHLSNHQPITFRLPSLGGRDPYFNLPRSKYYELETQGALKLIRLRDKGKKRGTTLVPFADVMRVIEEAR